MNRKRQNEGRRAADKSAAPAERSAKMPPGTRRRRSRKIKNGDAPPGRKEPLVDGAPPRTPRREAELDDAPEDSYLESQNDAELGIGSRVVPPDQSYHDVEARSRELPRELSPANDASSLADVESQIQTLEARLDGLIRRTSLKREKDAVATPRDGQDDTSEASRERARPSNESGADEALDEALDAARELLASDYFVKQWGRAGLRSRSEDVDDFGLDPEFERRFAPLFDFLYQRYFRVTTEGIDHIPSEGRCAIVANHSGTLPLDGAMLRTALRLEHPAKRELRWLAEDFVYYLPFVGTFMSRLGAVRACRENAERLLSKRQLIAIFPEGVKGISKLFRERYQLQRFGRGGYVRLCLRKQTPIVPCAVIGAEETNPILFRIEYVSRLLGVPYIPITPTFPLLGPFGLLPAPSKWRLLFGEPITFEQYGPEAAEDHVLVGRLSERVRGSIQTLLDRGLRARQGVWFG